MKLSVADRIKLLSLLPAEGDITTLKIVRDLQEALSFSEEEHTALKITQVGDRISWISEDHPLKVKDVVIGPKGRGMLKASLEALSEAKRLRPDLVPLYEQFVEQS